MNQMHSHILESATRAPSAHNTQPWELKLEDSAGGIYLRENRKLSAVDPLNLDMLHSAGAVLENIILTLAHFDFRVKYQISESIRFDQPIVRFDWYKDGQVEKDTELYQMIPIRRTSRLKYLETPISPDILQSISSLIRKPSEIFITHDPKALFELRTLVVSAVKEQMKDGRIVEEMYQWLRFSKKDPRWFQDGLNAECMGWSPIERSVASVILNPRFLESFSVLKLNDLLFSSVDSIAPNCPAVCLLTISNDNLKTRIEAGRDLQRVWLFLASKGLVTHPISAAVDVENTRCKVMQLFGVPLSHKHINLFRIGYSKPVARSPRLPVDEFLYEGGKKNG